MQSARGMFLHDKSVFAFGCCLGPRRFRCAFKLPLLAVLFELLHLRHWRILTQAALQHLWVLFRGFIQDFSLHLARVLANLRNSSTPSRSTEGVLPWLLRFGKAT